MPWQAVNQWICALDSGYMLCYMESMPLYMGLGDVWRAVLSRLCFWSGAWTNEMSLL